MCAAKEKLSVKKNTGVAALCVDCKKKRKFARKTESEEDCQFAEEIGSNLLTCFDCLLEYGCFEEEDSSKAFYVKFLDSGRRYRTM